MGSLCRSQEGTDLLSLPDTGQHILYGTGRNHCCRTGTGRYPRRLNLGSHAAAPQTAGAVTRNPIQQWIDHRALRDQFSVGFETGIAIEQPFLISQQHQQIRLHQVGHQGGQSIIVSNPQLFVGYCIVFIHHRHHAQPKQRPQRTARIEITLTADQIVVGQQHLSRMQPPLQEAGFIGTDQAHLSNGGSGLQLVEGCRATHPPYPAHPLRHCTGGDQHQLPPGQHPIGHLPDPAGEGFTGQPFAICRQQCAANLHYPAAGCNKIIASSDHLLFRGSQGSSSTGTDSSPDGLSCSLISSSRSISA